MFSLQIRILHCWDAFLHKGHINSDSRAFGKCSVTWLWTLCSVGNNGQLDGPSSHLIWPLTPLITAAHCHWFKAPWEELLESLRTVTFQSWVAEQVRGCDGRCNTAARPCGKAQGHCHEAMRWISTERSMYCYWLQCFLNKKSWYKAKFQILCSKS